MTATPFTYTRPDRLPLRYAFVVWGALACGGWAVVWLLLNLIGVT